MLRLTIDTPIIALNAHGTAGSRGKALAEGCDDFDDKPADVDRLLQRITHLLASKRAGQ